MGDERFTMTTKPDINRHTRLVRLVEMREPVFADTRNMQRFTRLKISEGSRGGKVFDCPARSESLLLLRPRIRCLAVEIRGEYQPGWGEIEGTVSRTIRVDQFLPARGIRV